MITELAVVIEAPEGEATWGAAAVDHPMRAVTRAVATGLSAGLPAGQEPSVSAAQRAQLHAALEQEGVTIAPEIWQGGTDIVDRVLGDEMVRAAQGEAGLLKRRAKRDKLVTRAVELLQGATTARSLVLGK